MLVYKEKDVALLEEGIAGLEKEADDLRLKYIRLAPLLQEPLAREFLFQGFLRRLSVLSRAAENIFSLAPPSRDDGLSPEERKDLEINLQVFQLNVFGALDNLAQIWVCERGITDGEGEALSPAKIGMGRNCREVRSSLPDHVRAKLIKFNAWFNMQSEFRHGVAHRLPLYMPPYNVREEHIEEHNRLEREAAKAVLNTDSDKYDQLRAAQEKLGHYVPHFALSPQSKSLLIHPTVLANYRTVLDLASDMVEPLRQWTPPTPKNRQPRPAKFAEAVEPYAAALGMVREAVEQLFGPAADLPNREAVGPLPGHEAEAIINGLQKVAARLERQES